MTDSSSPDSSPASRNTFAHHLGMKGFLLMEGLLKLVGMKTLYRLGRAAGAVAWYLLPQRRNIVERNLRIWREYAHFTRRWSVTGPCTASLTIR